LDKPDNLLGYAFHLPTLLVVAIIGVVLVWQLYDIGLAIGQGFLRLYTNHGNLSIYWHHGCCDINW